MRELKFRAWADNHWTDFIPTCRTHDEYNTNIIDNDSKSCGRIVEQYTGLKDRNGKEIYEGDIIQERYGKTVVEFSTEDIGSCGCCVPSFFGSGFLVTRNDNPENCEVIGNIHENPELLEEEK